MTNDQLDLLNRKLTDILNINKIQVVSNSSIQIGDKLVNFDPNYRQTVISKTTLTSR